MDISYLIALLAVLIVVWFAAGILYNLRRGRVVLRWLAGGLAEVEVPATTRWLSTSSAETLVPEPGPPFRQFEASLVLCPREVPWMWLWWLLRGRRDELVLRGILESVPHVVLELADCDTPAGTEVLHELTRNGWEPVRMPSDHPAFAAAGGAAGRQQLMAPQGRSSAALSVLPACLAALQALNPRFTRFSVRREPPSLEVHMPLPDTRTTNAADFLEAVAMLALALEK